MKRFVVEMDSMLAELLKKTGQMKIVESDGWNRVYGPSVDATGDDIGDTIDQYGLTLKEKIPGEEGERDTRIYMNADGTVKMVAKPYWAAGVGESYSLTVYKRG